MENLVRTKKVLTRRTIHDCISSKDSNSILLSLINLDWTLSEDYDKYKFIKYGKYNIIYYYMINNSLLKDWFIKNEFFEIKKESFDISYIEKVNKLTESVMTFEKEWSIHLDSNPGQISIILKRREQ